MGEKDIVSRTLESYNDVFADIINVFLLGGQEIIFPDELSDASSVSQYKADDKLRLQERDILKFWKNNGIKIASVGIENQSVSDKYMSARVIGYDGAAYRSQLNENGGGLLHPVITLVMYYGKEPWTAGDSLWDCLDIREELKPYVSNYTINIFDINKITEEQVSSLKSDFRHIAKYMLYRNNTDEYKPDDVEVRHLREVAEFLRVFEHDDRFVEIYNDCKDREGTTMCEFIDKFEAKGRAEGEAKGRAEERENGIRNAVLIYKKVKSSVEEAISGITELYGLSDEAARSKVQQYWNC